MKSKDLNQLKQKDASELSALVAEKRVQVLRYKAELATGRAKDLKVVKNARRDLAQILSTLKDKEKSNK